MLTVIGFFFILCLAIYLSGISIFAFIASRMFGVGVGEGEGGFLSLFFAIIASILWYGVFILFPFDISIALR